MKALATLLLFVSSFLHLHAQVNAYAQVSSISSTTIGISSSNETYGAFASGLPVIIMQMQDNTIGSNTSNNSSFGTLSSIQSTGQYEIAHVTAVTRSSGVVTQITISSLLANTYNINANSSVQLISYPLLSSSNYTTTADITAVSWNGSIGGVVAFRVTGTLTLNHNITADYAGFRGGAVNGGNAGSCDNVTYITAANENNANKGESIYKVTNTAFASGRAKVLNGGGGGNSHNAGGGGGSNASAGGEGGKGYGCGTSAGGLGGATLYSFIGSNRAFLGGAGGSGEANNSFNTTGGTGGGLIIIAANQIATTGTGSSLRISANGQTPSDVGNDGAGGGGAGGSVLLMVNSWSVVATKTLTISANGGNGGNVNDAAAHGGGGGGGQGAVIYSTVTPTSNITTTTLNGIGGRNFTGGTFADNASGSDNVGIFNSSFALLPVKMISFSAKKSQSTNELGWSMVNESDISFYEVQRSYDGTNFETIGNLQKNSAEYAFIDYGTADKNSYYRIVMHDNSGHFQYSSVVMVRSKNNSPLLVSLAPNPVRNYAWLNIESECASTASIGIVNSLGMYLSVKNINLNKGYNKIQLDNISSLIAGTYHVIIKRDGHSSVVKMLISR